MASSIQNFPPGTSQQTGTRRLVARKKTNKKKPRTKCRKKLDTKEFKFKIDPEKKQNILMGNCQKIAFTVCTQ